MNNESCTLSTTSQLFSFILNATSCLCILCTYLSGYFLKHLANMSILASSSSLTEPIVSSLPCCIFLVCPVLPNGLLFAPNDSHFTCPPLLTTGRFNIAIRVNNMRVLHLMYNGHIYTSHTKLFISFFTLFLHSWAGRLAPTTHVGNTTE